MHTSTRNILNIVVLLCIIALAIFIAIFSENNQGTKLFAQVITIKMSVVILVVFAMVNFMLIVNFLYTVYTQNKKILEGIEKEKQIEKAKNEFISLISHQFRTPLSAINWYTEALTLGDLGEINDKQKSYLANLHESNQRMISLVNSIVDVSRIELHTFVPNTKSIEVFPLIETIANSFDKEIESKNITFHKDYTKELCDVEIDKRYIQMILENLLSNAIKYTPRNGTVRLAVQCNNNMLNIVVTDTGYGIPQTELKNVFLKLFRASNIKDKEPSGTGIGLYIVKSIVDYAGGKISVESKENVGSTFSVTLPTTNT